MFEASYSLSADKSFVSILLKHSYFILPIADMFSVDIFENSSHNLWTILKYSYSRVYFKIGLEIVLLQCLCCIVVPGLLMRHQLCVHLNVLKPLRQILCCMPGQREVLQSCIAIEIFCVLSALQYYSETISLTQGRSLFHWQRFYSLF